MATPHHCRAATWLTAILVALWPAAAAQACCCTALPTPTEAGGCPSGCCAAQSDAESCCHPASAANHDHDACVCGHVCGAGEVRAKLTGTLDKSGSSLPAALAGDGWLTATWPAVSDLESRSDRPDVPARPKRILYGVWRN